MARFSGTGPYSEEVLKAVAEAEVVKRQVKIVPIEELTPAYHDRGVRVRQFLKERSPQADETVTLDQVIAKVNLKHFPIPVQLRSRCGYLEISAQLRCRDTGQIKQLHFDYMPPVGKTLGKLASETDRFDEPRYTYAEGMQFVYQCLFRMITHELDEAFHFMDARVFDPHEPDGRNLKKDIMHDYFRYDIWHYGV
jgi:hypothetical protein